MTAELGIGDPQVLEGIIKTTDAFMQLFEYDLLADDQDQYICKLDTTRRWAENIAKFSEKPIKVESVDFIGVGKAVRLTLTAYNRDLYLDFYGQKAVKINYNDGKLKQTSEIVDPDLWNNIILLYKKKEPFRLLFINEGGSIAITKENRSVVVQPSLQQF